MSNTNQEQHISRTDENIENNDGYAVNYDHEGNTNNRKTNNEEEEDENEDEEEEEEEEESDDNDKH